MAEKAKIWQKRAKNSPFFAVFGIFEPKIHIIRPPSATFLDSVGQNGAFKPILKIFPIVGAMGVTKNWFFGIGGTLCDQNLGNFLGFFGPNLVKICEFLAFFLSKLAEFTVNSQA